MVAPSRRLEVASDPDDNMFLECADTAGPDYLVTGNQKHFPVFWKKTKIITSREFISLAAPHFIGQLMLATSISMETLAGGW
jgi:uncharacterized protein